MRSLVIGNLDGVPVRQEERRECYKWWAFPVGNIEEDEMSRLRQKKKILYKYSGRLLRLVGGGRQKVECIAGAVLRKSIYIYNKGRLCLPQAILWVPVHPVLYARSENIGMTSKTNQASPGKLHCFSCPSVGPIRCNPKKIPVKRNINTFLD